MIGLVGEDDPRARVPDQGARNRLAYEVTAIATVNGKHVINTSEPVRYNTGLCTYQRQILLGLSLRSESRRETPRTCALTCYTNSRVRYAPHSVARSAQLTVIYATPPCRSRAPTT